MKTMLEVTSARDFAAFVASKIGPHNLNFVRTSYPVGSRMWLMDGHLMLKFTSIPAAQLITDPRPFGLRPVDPRSKVLQFESKDATHGDQYAMLQVTYYLDTDPGEIIEVIDLDTGKEMAFLELAPIDAAYVIERLKEQWEDRIPDKDEGVDEEYEKGRDRERLD